MGYRPRGYASSSRRVTDLPPPPATREPITCSHEPVAVHSVDSELVAQLCTLCDLSAYVHPGGRWAWPLLRPAPRPIPGVRSWA